MDLTRYLENLTTSYFPNRSDSLPGLMKLAGLKHTRKNKAEMVEGLNAYLGNEERIIALWNQLHGFEKELMEEYVRTSQAMEREEINQIAQKYNMEYSRSYSYYSSRSPVMDFLDIHSPARLFFIGTDIPEPMFAVLQKLVKPIEIQFTPLQEPTEDGEGHLLCIGAHFERDLIAIVKLVNSSKLRATKEGGLPTKAAVLKMNEVLEYKEPFSAVGSLEDVRGVEQTVRVYGIARLLLAASVLRNDNGVLAVGSQAEAFLISNPVVKCKMLLSAYVNAFTINELARIPEITAKTERFPLLTSCRELILSYLRLCPVNEWIDRDELLGFIKKRDRLFLEKATGEILTYDSYERTYYSGLHDWHEVEGRFVQVVLLEYLSVIGIVDVVIRFEDTEECTQFEVVDCFRLTGFGAYILGVHDAYEQEASRSSAPLYSGLDVRENGDVAVSSDVHRLFFDRFAEKVSEGATTVYSLTFAGMVNALNQGIAIREIADYMAGHSERGVPAAVSQMLENWERKCGKIRIRQATIVETDDLDLMVELKKAKPIRNHIVNELAYAFEIDGKASAKIKKEIEKKQHFCTVESDLIRG